MATEDMTFDSRETLKLVSMQLTHLEEALRNQFASASAAKYSLASIT